MVFGSIGALIDPNAGASPGRRKEGDEELKENPQKWSRLALCPFEAHCILSISFSRKFLTSLHWSKTLRFPHSAVTLLDWTVTFAKLSELLIFDASCHMFLPLFPRSFSNICIALYQSFPCSFFLFPRSFSMFSSLFLNILLALSQYFDCSFSLFSSVFLNFCLALNRNKYLAFSHLETK